MSSIEDTGSIVVPSIKRPTPPAYVGLPDAATFGRLASRPNAINPQARAFFEAWLSDARVVLRRRDGRLVLKPEFRPLGTAAFFEDESDYKDTAPAAAAPSSKK